MSAFRNLGDLMRGDGAKVAIIDLGRDGAGKFTYAEIDAMANGIARALLRRGLKRGERVAILPANCAE